MLSTRPRRNLLNDYSFQDLLFQCMLSATEEQKKMIPEQYLKYFADRRSMHRFCLHQPHERQKIMFHYLGHTWVTIFGMNEEDLEIAMSVSGDQNKIPEKRNDFINAMTNKKIVATSSREMMMNMMMIDVNSKSYSYNINKNSVELSRHSKRWNNIPTIDIMQKEASEAYASLSKIIGRVLLNADNTISLTGLSQFQLQILLLLIEDRYSAFTQMGIANRLGKQNELTLVKKSLDYLVYKDMLVVDIKDEKRDKGVVKDTNILIGERGIKVVMTYLNHVINKALDKQK